mgnify:CR=1 FL=1
MPPGRSAHTPQPGHQRPPLARLCWHLFSATCVQQDVVMTSSSFTRLTLGSDYLCGPYQSGRATVFQSSSTSSLMGHRQGVAPFLLTPGEQQPIAGQAPGLSGPGVCTERNCCAAWRARSRVLSDKHSRTLDRNNWGPPQGQPSHCTAGLSRVPRFFSTRFSSPVESRGSQMDDGP